MKIVEQPFGGRRDREALSCRIADELVSLVQDSAVFPHPRYERALVRGVPRDRLRKRQALRVLLEALSAEQFRADRLFEFGKVGRTTRTPQTAECLQSHPSLTWARGRARQSRKYLETTLRSSANHFLRSEDTFSKAF